MRKLKKILSAMLVVVIAVAAVVVYAPTEAYAVTWWEYYINVSGTDFENGSIVIDPDSPNSYELSEDSDVILLKCDAGLYLTGCCLEVKLNYGNTTINDISNNTINASWGYDTVWRTNLSEIKGWIGDNAPAKIKMELTDITVNDATHAVATFVLTDPDAKEPEAASSSSNTSVAHTHTWKYGTIFDATEDTDGLEGYYCSCGANKETTIIPSITAIYKNRYAQMDHAASYFSNRAWRYHQA